MSRSKKKVIGNYQLLSANPKKGKEITSRRIRRKVNQRISHSLEEIPIESQDKKRGKKGSRCEDYGWKFFGDGFSIDWKNARNVTGISKRRNFMGNVFYGKYIFKVFKILFRDIYP